MCASCECVHHVNVCVNCVLRKCAQTAIGVTRGLSQGESLVEGAHWPTVGNPLANAQKKVEK